MNIRIMPLLTIMTLLLSGVALAQDPQVSSANPSSALQGAIGLDVDITGANFEVGAAVKFFVSGSKKTELRLGRDCGSRRSTWLRMPQYRASTSKFACPRVAPAKAPTCLP